MLGGWAVVGGLVVTIGGGLGLWYGRTRLSAILTTADVDPAETPTKSELSEVRDMAQQAMEEAAEAQELAETAQRSIDGLTRQLVESTNEADDPLLVRIQERLNSIESELQRQSRVESERAVNMGRIAAILEDMDGVDADDVDLDALADELPDPGPLSEYNRDDD